MDIIFKEYKREIIEIMQKPNRDELLVSFFLKKGLTNQHCADLMRECTELLKQNMPPKG